MRIAQLGWAPLINIMLRKSSSVGLCVLYQESEEAKGCKPGSYNLARSFEIL